MPCCPTCTAELEDDSCRPGMLWCWKCCRYWLASLVDR